MAIDTYKLGWNTGGKIVFGTNPYYPNTEGITGEDWDETSGITDPLRLDVLMTGGEISKTRTPATELMASIGEIDANESRVKVLLSDGVQIVNGSISFTCDKSYLQSLLEYIFTKRKRSLSIYVGTENFSYVKAASCKWSSFTINCSEGALVNCSLALIGNRDIEEVRIDNEINAEFTEIYKNSNIIPYWQTGALLDTDALKISSWDLNVNQSITPVYLNNKDHDFPAYMRIANWDFQLSAQMLTETKDYDTIQFGINNSLQPIRMSLDSRIQLGSRVSFGGLDAMGNYEVSMELVGKPGNYLSPASTEKPFEITPEFS